MLTDYNCRIFDINKFELLNSSLNNELQITLDQIKSDLFLMHECGFHRFICPVRFNENFPTSYTIKSINALQKFSSKATPRNCGKISIKFVPKIYLSSEAPYIKNLSDLKIKNTNFALFELPMQKNPEYIPETLNKILYNCHLTPIFTEFQIINMLYSPDEIDKMIRIKNAAFQFNIKSIYDNKNILLINKILKNNNTVLLGTNFNHQNLNIAQINISLDKFKRKISSDVYNYILLSSRKLISF